VPVSAAKPLDVPGLFAEGDVHVGQDLGGRDIPVDAEALDRYRIGTASPDAPADPVPALLFHSEVYRRLDWYLPNIIGNLHARQEWEVFHPMRLGETVRSRSTVVDRYRKRDRLYVVNEVVLADAGGRWLQRSRTHQSFLADEPGDDVVVDRERERRADRRFALPEGDGERLASVPRTITLAMCEAFSGPSRNYHTDREMARALGFPDVVVQGMMSVCFVAELVAARFGMGWHQGGRLDVRLVNVVWPEDVITTRGRVREIVAEGRRRRVHLDVWCEKADGTVTVVGTASGLE
jgi:acyl dehydratase